MTCSGIYQISIGERYYIGSAANLERRKREHLSQLHRGVHFNVRVQRAWDKYGVFEWRILEECDSVSLLEREQLYLDEYYDGKDCLNFNPTAKSPLGYKLSPEQRKRKSEASLGTGNPFFGKRHTPESKEKIRQARLARGGRLHSEESKERIRQSHLGKRFSDAHRQALSEAHLNPSIEIRKKLSAAAKGRVISSEQKAKASATMKEVWRKKKEASLEN